MRKFSCSLRAASAAALAVAIISAAMLASSLAQQEGRPAFVIVERLATTADESIQEEYAKLARDILPNTARAISRAAEATRCSKVMSRCRVAWRS